MTTTKHQEELLDEALEETFPASDVPRAFDEAKQKPAAGEPPKPTEPAETVTPPSPAGTAGS